MPLLQVVFIIKMLDETPVFHQTYQNSLILSFQIDGSEENNDPNSMEIPKETQFVYNGTAEEQDTGPIMLISFYIILRWNDSIESHVDVSSFYRMLRWNDSIESHVDVSSFYRIL